ncbi:MAG: Filamentous hemagglutinin family outer membrane protein [Candidatus Peregrinibacteria bacterium GW2011_GWF2_38_29]|nr:MAG: Filamentous hemagglutinin family outer membrane protein [Candidatus Peregrinibacteria bacterium GW2011_GWF2_38_29]
MLKLFNKNRLKIGLIIASLLFCVFIIPTAANVLAYSSANLVKSEVSRLIAVDPVAAPVVTPPETPKPAMPQIVEVDETVKLLLDIMKILSIILQLLARLLWPILFLCGALMENDIIFGGAMGERLHEVWIQIRNIANLLFVLMLVGTAIYNISGFASEKLQLKQMLPKIIMGLILVNFSYMISTVALDAISVGTTAMFGLPRAIGISMQDDTGVLKISDDVQNSLCTAISSAGKMESETLSGKANKAAEEISKSAQKAFCVKDPKDPNKLIASPTLQGFISDWAPHSATIIMAVEFMHMQDLQNAVMGSNLTLSSLTINMLFSIVMFFIYGMAFVILFIVLLMRAITVWLAIVLSPLLVVVYVVPEITEKAGGNMKEVVTKAISITTAPMVIGFVLSIGYIMMTSLGATGQVGEGVQFQTLLQDTLTWNTNISGLANFQEIMIAIGTVGFIWAGIKAATDKTVAKGATDTIMKGVSSAGSWLGKAAVMYPSIIPVPGGSHEGKESMGTLLKTFDKAVRAPELASEEKASNLAQRMGFERGSGSMSQASMVSELSNIKQGDTTAGLDNLVVRLSNPEAITPEVAKGIESGIKKTSANGTGHTNREAQDAYEKMLRLSTQLKEEKDPTRIKELQKDMFNAVKEFKDSAPGKAAFKNLNQPVAAAGATTGAEPAATPSAAAALDANGKWKTDLSKLGSEKDDTKFETDLKVIIEDMKAKKVSAEDQKKYIEENVKDLGAAKRTRVIAIVDSVNTPAAGTTAAPAAGTTPAPTPAPAPTPTPAAGTPPPTPPATGTTTP